VLHAVTHPCPEDLAVLLVHTVGATAPEKYLLMANAGGCRPLQGTDIVFGFGTIVTIPDNDASTVPYGYRILTGAADYGVDPVFPAPAPPGPYLHSAGAINNIVSGTWSLFVIDTRAGKSRRDRWRMVVGIFRQRSMGRRHRRRRDTVAPAVILAA
jgi:hypothetical protein